MRYLTGAHGLRPIRVRLVGYLVAPRAVRAIAAEVTAAFPSAILPAATAPAADLPAAAVSEPVRGGAAAGCALS